MKTKILLSFCLLCFIVTSYGSSWTIDNVGFSFTPSSFTISYGDSVNFVLASIHNAVEVSEATWNADGNAPLTDGFETPFGGGLVLPSKLTLGTHYYVCTSHASMGMKGIITVLISTGLPEFQPPTTFTVFPNPTSDFVNIKASNDILNAKYFITDLSGRRFMFGVLNSNPTLVDLNRFPPGEYFIEIIGQRRQSIKLVKN